MTAPPSGPPAHAKPPTESEDIELFDYRYVRHLVGFVLRGTRRHRLLTLATLVLAAGAGAAVVVLFPRTWHAESRLLANQNQLIRALGNPRSPLPSDDPTRAARELVFAHENLVSLIKQTGLLKSWEETRPAVVRAKDLAARMLFGPLSDEDRIDAMVGTLEKRLRVETDSQTVTISVDWPDPQAAYLLVDTAQQNFLETRHVTEMAAINEALAILEAHASDVQKTVDEALLELERTRERRRRGVMLAPAAPPTETGTTPPSPGPAPRDNSELTKGPTATEQELAQLKFLLNAKRRALADLEDFRQRRIGELTATLQEQKVQYADRHPVVLDTIERIEVLKSDSPQIIAVKGDIASLLQEYARKGGKAPDSLVEPRRGPDPRFLQSQAALTAAELYDDPRVEFARNNLRVAAAKYEELMMRQDSARIEQDTARAAFKYRYSVVRPASVPRRPVKPNTPLLAGLALVAALSLALVAGGTRDFLSGRFVEPWQVERALELKVLGRLKAS